MDLLDSYTYSGLDTWETVDGGGIKLKRKACENRECLPALWVPFQVKGVDHKF